MVVFLYVHQQCICVGRKWWSMKLMDESQQWRNPKTMMKNNENEDEDLIDEWRWKHDQGEDKDENMT